MKLKSSLVDLKWLNNYLKNLEDLRTSKFFIQKQVVNEVIYDQEDQGVTGEWYEIYRLPDESNELFLKLKIITDSYGNGESIAGLEFVEGKEKVITIYE